MFIACQQGNLELIQWLYAHGGSESIVKRINDGTTCLEIATFKNHVDVMQYLLDRGGDQIPHSYYYRYHE